MPFSVTGTGLTDFGNVKDRRAFRSDRFGDRDRCNAATGNSCGATTTSEPVANGANSFTAVS